MPVATYTSWNLRHRSVGAEGELLSLQGGYVPFVRTRQERVARGDPRPALLERYKDFEGYLAKYRAAVASLLSAGYLLEEDRELLETYARRNEKRFREE